MLSPRSGLPPREARPPEPSLPIGPRRIFLAGNDRSPPPLLAPADRPCLGRRRIRPARQRPAAACAATLRGRAGTRRRAGKSFFPAGRPGDYDLGPLAAAP